MATGSGRRLWRNSHGLLNLILRVAHRMQTQRWISARRIAICWRQFGFHTFGLEATSLMLIQVRRLRISNHLLIIIVVGSVFSGSDRTWPAECRCKQLKNAGPFGRCWWSYYGLRLRLRLLNPISINNNII